MRLIINWLQKLQHWALMWFGISHSLGCNGSAPNAHWSCGIKQHQEAESSHSGPCQPNTALAWRKRISGLLFCTLWEGADGMTGWKVKSKWLTVQFWCSLWRVCDVWAKNLWRPKIATENTNACFQRESRTDVGPMLAETVWTRSYKMINYMNLWATVKSHNGAWHPQTWILTSIWKYYKESFSRIKRTLRGL